jgi:hypothetical protein
MQNQEGRIKKAELRKKFRIAEKNRRCHALAQVFYINDRRAVGDQSEERI